MKIYISGQITGLDEKQAFANFEKAEKLLSNSGFTVVNPMKLEHKHDKSWRSYMKEDIKALMDCTHLYAMKNSINSNGAIIEYQLARDLEFEIIYEV